MHPLFLFSYTLFLCVQGYKQRRAYIATHGPLSETVVDMWRMIWENDCCCIIMLCRTVENGQVCLNTMISLPYLRLILLVFHTTIEYSSCAAKNVWLYVSLPHFIPFLSGQQESSYCFWPQRTGKGKMYGKIRIWLKMVSAKIISSSCKVHNNVGYSIGHSPCVQ